LTASFRSAQGFGRFEFEKHARCPAQNRATRRAAVKSSWFIFFSCARLRSAPSGKRATFFSMMARLAFGSCAAAAPICRHSIRTRQLPQQQSNAASHKISVFSCDFGPSVRKAFRQKPYVLRRSLSVSTRLGPALITAANPVIQAKLFSCFRRSSRPHGYKMLRICALAVIWPFRLCVFLYMRCRGFHRKLIVDLDIHGDYPETPLSHGIWAMLKPARDRFYLLALDLQNILNGVTTGKLKLRRLRITFESHSLGWAQAWELRSLVRAIRAAGVETHAYLLSDSRVSLYIATCLRARSGPREFAGFDLTPFHERIRFLAIAADEAGREAPVFVSRGIQKCCRNFHAQRLLASSRASRPKS
jgi:hypothetical protein